jgi:acyl-CoA synthetase (AMP-forming)/AMP-acid ligase II
MDQRKKDTTMHPDISGWMTRLSADAITRFTASGAWSGITLAHSATERVRKTPHVVAVVDGQHQLSFVELFTQASRLAASLRRSGMRPGDVLSFQLPNWHETMVINLAACLGGFVCNPIVPIYRDAEVGFILRDCRSRVLFVPETFRSIDYVAMVERLRPGLPQLKDVVLVRASRPGYAAYDDWAGTGSMAAAEAEAEAETEPMLEAAEPDPNAVKLLLYTSGTTGDPKGVLHSHNTLRAEIDAVETFWSLTKNDVVLMPSPVTHITGYLYALEMAFALAIKVVFMERWQPDEAARLIADHRVTFSIGATPFLADLVHALEARATSLPSLRLFGCGGAPVPPEIIRRAGLVLPNCQAFRIYGSSEAPTVTLGVAAGDPKELGATTDGCIANHEVRIVDPETGEPVPPGTEGEILTRGPEMMHGYTKWQHTLDAFDADGFFRTGDLGFLSHDRYLTISGRKKDLIIRGGENISPKEIEDVMHRHPDILEAAVVAMPHVRMGETPIAYVVLRSGRTLELAALTAFLDAARLAKQKFPERLVVVDELPHTATGKVLKHVLRARSRALQ